MVRRLRLDAELVRRQLARSREQAGELIEAGRVQVRGNVATKAATGVEQDTPIRVVADTEDPGYASRGAHKLIGALAEFATLWVAGRRCLDAGASTGGFTDVLLRRGAREVVAVDVGYGQLVWALQSDPRVVVHDRTNVRTLTPEQIGGPADLTVADLSFISLGLVLPALTACTVTDLVPMVKPQFEVGRHRLGRGGVVREPALRAESVLAVARTAHQLGWGTAGVARSPLPGPSGNVEFFLWLRQDAGPPDPAMIDTVAHELP
jgi:23S rRNA (cytidine1920-2'-O)/16S rRNA (cytidine1409-2'-O)-methyltransferase